MAQCSEHGDESEGSSFPQDDMSDDDMTRYLENTIATLQQQRADIEALIKVQLSVTILSHDKSARLILDH